jgi:hypothetical protein
MKTGLFFLFQCIIMKILYVLFAFTTSYCIAQTATLRGNIYDRIEKKGLNASIYILGLKKIANTNEKGDFVIKNIPDGVYNVKISTFFLYKEEIITAVKFSKGVTTYLHYVMPTYCKYEDVTVDHKICPICHKKDNVVQIVYAGLGCSPIYKKEFKHKELAKKQEESTKDKEFYDPQNNTYKISDIGFNYCELRWYCKDDKVKF